jgi:hypothetical protein
MFPAKLIFQSRLEHQLMTRIHSSEPHAEAPGEPVPNLPIRAGKYKLGLIRERREFGQRTERRIVLDTGSQRSPLLPSQPGRRLDAPAALGPRPVKDPIEDDVSIQKAGARTKTRPRTPDSKAAPRISAHKSVAAPETGVLPPKPRNIRGKNDGAESDFIRAQWRLRTSSCRLQRS